MRMLVLALIVAALVYYASADRGRNANVALPTQAAKVAASTNEIATVDSLIASELYSSDAILEFKPGGRPFETTESSHILNRDKQTDRILRLKNAASSQNKLIAADLNLYRVAWRAGYFDKQAMALKKTIADLQALEPEDQYYDRTTPLGTIISAMQRFRNEDDAREQKDSAAQDELAKAQAAAGVANRTSR